MRIYYSDWYTDHRYDEIFMPSSIRDVLAPRLFALAGKQTNNKLLISLTIIKYSVICLCIRHVQDWGTKNIHSQNTIKLNSTSFKVVAIVFSMYIFYLILTITEWKHTESMATQKRALFSPTNPAGIWIRKTIQKEK